MSDLTYRPLAGENAEIFRRLRLRALKENQSAFLESYDEAAGQSLDYFRERIEKNWIIGCFDADELVGVTLLAQMQGQLQRHKGYIGAVYVALEMRGRGVAQRLLALAIERAETLGLELLQLGANAHNPALIALYEKFGFTEYGIDRHVTKLVDGSYVDDVLMVKFLKEPA